MAKQQEMEFLEVMTRIAREDRELYRQLRAEAWALVQQNHQAKSSEQRRRWLRGAS